MKGNFDACLAETLVYEGGWSDHPRDPGGATMKGVTIGRFRQYYPAATKDDLRAITNDMVEKIYRVDYWDKVAGDKLNKGVDLVTFDAGVNSGPAQGAKWTQRAVGVKDDGIIGAASVAAINAADPVVVVKSACAKRMSMLRGLKTFDVFGAGWSRRVAGIEALGVKMALGDKAAGAVQSRLVDEADAAASQSATAKASGTASAVAGGGGVSLADIPVYAQVVAGVFIVAVVVIFVLRSRKHAIREAAYLAAAERV